MSDTLSRLPDDQSLARALTCVLAGAGSAAITIVDRMSNPDASTFPSEMITCRLDNGERLQLFCKYGTGHGHDAHGHRGGVGYEAEIYDRVLSATKLSVPHFHGSMTIGPGGEIGLIIAHLQGCLRLRDSRDLDHWEQAAAWSGRFHAEEEARSPDPSLAFLIHYDADYYAGWARRTAENAAALDLKLPWLADLCSRAPAAFLELLESPQTVIHGEYYPKNLLIKDATIYPVDWESAAIACGQIDLATLTDRCDPDVVLRCDHAYHQARWPQGVPSGFTRALELARLYVHLRWLGADPSPKLRRRPWRYEEARALGERLSLI